MFKDKFSKDSEPKLVENLDADTFKQRLEEDENAVLIDVRTPMEHQEKRIPNSMLIDISNSSFSPEINKLDKSKNYYLYCRSGSRSFVAGMQMLSMGFINVCHLQTGIIGWKGETEK